MATCLYSHGAPYISEFLNLKNVEYNLRGISTRLPGTSSIQFGVYAPIFYLFGQ